MHLSRAKRTRLILPVLGLHSLVLIHYDVLLHAHARLELGARGTQLVHLVKNREFGSSCVAHFVDILVHLAQVILVLIELQDSLHDKPHVVTLKTFSICHLLYLLNDLAKGSIIGKVRL